MSTSKKKPDGRRKSYIAYTPFQAWIQAILLKNEEEGKPFAKYQEIAQALIKAGQDVSENYIYKLVRGNPEKTNIYRAGHDITYAIGELLGDISGALQSAGYKTQEEEAPKEITRVLEPDTERLVHYYEGLGRGNRRIAQSLLEQLWKTEHLGEEEEGEIIRINVTDSDS